MSRMRLVKIVVALQEKPRTNAELVEISGFTRDNVRLCLDRLQEAGFADVVGRGPEPARGPAPVLWGWKPK